MDRVLFQLILFANKPVTNVSHNNQQYCTSEKIGHPTNDLSNSYPESLTEKKLPVLILL